jgi:hypothetical protein
MGRTAMHYAASLEHPGCVRALAALAPGAAGEEEDELRWGAPPPPLAWALPGTDPATCIPLWATPARPLLARHR